MKKVILVVDDDPALLETTRAILEMEGFEVHTQLGAFGTGSLVQRLDPDLILLDVHMPALSGDNLVPLLRAGTTSNRDVPIVFHSSNDEASLRALVMKLGVRGYVCKGDLGQLRVRVARYLATSSIPGTA